MTTGEILDAEIRLWARDLRSRWNSPADVSVVAFVPCSIRSVLKHGPRSLTCARVIGCFETYRRNEGKDFLTKVDGGCLVPALMGMTRPHSGGVLSAFAREAHRERTRWDPKDGELCLGRTKPEETLVEVRFDSDVQIDRRTLV